MRLLGAVVVVALALPASAAAQVEIVFAAGPKDHGAPGRHEYARDLAALKACLDTSNVPNLRTSIYTGRVPDVSALAGAAVLVMESSGDRTPTEQHVLRRQLLNGIVWAANLEVPPGGVECELPQGE
jgi:hypothetical protein